MKDSVFTETVAVQCVSYVVLPLLFILMRSVMWSNVPKLDLFFAWGSLATWIQIVFLIWLGVTDNMDRFTTDVDLFVAFIILFSMVAEVPLIANMLHSSRVWDCISCGENGKTPPMYPIPREETHENLMKLMEKIRSTGPTLVTGKMIVTGTRQNGNSRINLYDWVWWSQFVYKSWRNKEAAGLDEVESLLRENKTFIVRTCVEILPENDRTVNDYKSWHQFDNFGEGECNCCMPKKASTTRWECFNQAMRFIEEIVTSPELGDDHQPSGTVPTLQLPCHIKAENYAWPTSKDRILIMKPWWIKYGLYDLSAFLFLAPLLRLFFWITTKTVHVKFVKTFNTDDSGFSRNINDKLFMDNLHGFNIKHF